MGLTANVVANTPILSTWGNEIRDRSVQVFASIAERASQWPTPPAGATSQLSTAPGQLHVYNGTVWVQITPLAAAQNGTSTRTNTAYGDLADGAVPAVTILTGTKAIVSVSANINNSGGASAVFMGYAVSGATTIAATDSEALALTAASATQLQAGYESYITGLTAGLNTFTAKYRAAGGTITASVRKLRVTPVP